MLRTGQMNSLGRFGDPEDLGTMIAFLASEGAGYINGQNLLLDGMSYPLMYQRFDQQLGEEGAADLSMLTEFMRDWYAESTRWVDAMLKVVLAESAENREQIQAWVDTWEPRAYAALQPLAEAATGQAALDEVRAALAARLHKLGLRSPGVAA